MYKNQMYFTSFRTFIFPLKNLTLEYLNIKTEVNESERNDKLDSKLKARA